MPVSTSNDNAIQLANLNFSSKATTDFDSSNLNNPFDTSLPTSPNTLNSTKPNAKFNVKSIPWNKLVNILWMMLPILLHTSSIIFLATAIFQQSTPYLELTQTPGPGRVIYGILGACVVLQDSTTACGTRSLNADFVPSLQLVSDKIPGFAILELPFYSDQTPSIFFTALILLSLSFAIFIFPWSLAYFPKLNYPRKLKNSIRDNPRRWYQVAGVLSFISFVFTLTIGVGYKLFLSASIISFSDAINYALLAGDISSAAGTTGWNATIGEAFKLVWISSVLQALTTLGMNVALHNRIDLVIERGGEEKQSSHNYY